MDRRLRELQQELAAVGTRPAASVPAPALSAPAPALSAPPPAPSPPAANNHASEADIRAAADAAREFLRSAQALVEEYEKAIRRAAALAPQPAAYAPPAFPAPAPEPTLAPAPQPMAPAPAPQPPPQQPPGVPPLTPRGEPAPPPAYPQAPAPAPALVQAPAPAPPQAWPVQTQAQPWPPAPAPAAPPAPAPPPSPYETIELDGTVVLNAGPFAEIATLSAFEQALERVPRISDVYVRGFEGNRALIDLKLDGAVRLVEEMRRAVPFGFTVTEAGSGRLTVDMADAG
jgi:hypothetical protein